MLLRMENKHLEQVEDIPHRCYHRMPSLAPPRNKPHNTSARFAAIFIWSRGGHIRVGTGKCPGHSGQDIQSSGGKTRTEH